MTTNKTPFALGALPSPEAEKLTAWTLASVGAPTVYPTSAFLPSYGALNVTNQGQIGSCVGNTFEEIVRYIVMVLGGATQEELSWRFVYAMCKALEGTVYQGTDYRIYSRTAGANDGTYPALAAMVIRKFGVPLAKYCPNEITLSADDFCYGRNIANIPAAAIADAATRKSGADLTEPVSEDGIKKAINYAVANKGAVAILRRIGATYWQDEQGNYTQDKAKLLPIRVPATFVSGHEEFLYGYDTEEGTGRTRIYWQNHWGTDWCSTGGNGTDGGRGWEYLDVWLPYIYELRVVIPALPPAPDNFTYTFTKPLKKGMRGADVVALQHILDLEGVYNYNGTPKYTGYFGDVTFAAVIALQNKYAAEILTPAGLKQGTGYVGSSTLAWLAKHYSPSK